MKKFHIAVRTLVAAIMLLWASVASAQQVGQCNDMMRGQAFAIYANGFMQQIGNPANSGQYVRDPSGQTFIRFPSLTPQVNAFFVDWQGRLIEINLYTGANQIGMCQFANIFIPPNPYASLPPPVMQPGYFVDVPGGAMAVPQAFADPQRPYGVPLIASEAAAVGCAQSSTTGAQIDRARFGDCMVRQMVGQRERAAYDCARSGGDENAVALCMVGVFGGANERAAAQAISQCYAQFGEQWSQYPLCMANGSVGGDAGKLLACVQQQGGSGDVTLLGTAACYGAGKFDLNPEMQIIAGCAAASGGEPYSFAGCAGGQLTARELDKCLTGGVGGANGCFGPNNTIIRGLRDTGNFFRQEFGPTNTIVQTWNGAVNGLTQAPGPNNTAVKTLRNVANEVGRGTNNVAREVKKVLPRIRCC